VEKCWPCPVFANFTMAFALQLRKKHGKTSVRLRKNLIQSTVYILPKHPHITKPSQTHKTLTNKHAPSKTLELYEGLNAAGKQVLLK
jgi:hypothetical protein